MSLLPAKIKHWEDTVDMDAAAPPLEHNPSAWSQRIPIVVLAATGGVIAACTISAGWAEPTRSRREYYKSR